LKLRRRRPAGAGGGGRTISEAEERAGRLRGRADPAQGPLRRAGLLPLELLQDGNYFHAVLEATKSVADKIRQKSGLARGRLEPVDQAFSLGQIGVPFLAFNSLQTDGERGEQSGLMNLMKGLFGTFRNPTAAAPKVSWRMSEDDALDLLSMASYVHRRLDLAVRTPRQAA
jgi:uncharacterized protein (TIGR02391 family)